MKNKKQGNDTLKSDPKKLAADKARRDKKFAEKVSKVTPAGQELAKTPQYDVVATARKKVESEQLAPIAVEINERFRLAAQLSVKSDDHRLSAAIQLEAAKKICDEEKINFRAWVETNIDQKYDTVRKLIYVAAAPEPAKALADMRERNAQANQKLRATKKAAPEGKQGPTVTPFKRAAEAVDALADNVAVELVKGVAKKAGMAVVSETELKTLKEAAKAPVDNSIKGVTMPGMKDWFAGMAATDKMAFVEWAAAEIGFQVVNPLSQAERDQKDLAIPAELRRRKVAE